MWKIILREVNQKSKKICDIMKCCKNFLDPLDSVFKTNLNDLLNMNLLQFWFPNCHYPQKLNSTNMVTDYT